MLDDALITSSLLDPDAIELWRTHFGRQEGGQKLEAAKNVVPFESLAQALFKKLRVNLPPPLERGEEKRYLCLYALLTEGTSPPVTSMNKFGQLVCPRPLSTLARTDPFR